ncbi:hypothetical protein [Alicyclobacillus mengziensis]|uniref:Uncharacterized protein n=1 Tax=Alicyclobacillus mengziensis TaxID=2931921 RepID=A0A9X7W1Q6_9BACL|nr:hypothetical protein [Alicyclobacillus mengziensis]QSO48719.1 hypothetical protein JZ786_07085 [Alicyclobacillus mengziensis]
MRSVQKSFFVAGALLVGGIIIGFAEVLHHPSSVTTVSKGSNTTTVSFNPTQFNWQENGAGGQRYVQVIQGSLTATGGTVKTDTDCTADSAGLSHCHNVIELDNRSQITVIDTHNMSKNPCLNPGERVNLQPVSQSFVKLVVVFN